MLTYEQLKEGNKLIWYFHHIMDNPYLMKDVEPSYFGQGPIAQVYEVSRNTYFKEGRVAQADEVKDRIRTSYSREEISDAVIDTILRAQGSGTQATDPEFVKSAFNKWLEYSKVEGAIKKSISYLKTAGSDVDLIEAISSIYKKEITRPQQEGGMVDIFDMSSYDFVKKERFSSGYEFIDECLGGGFWKGSLITFMAGAKVGKSAWMVNLAREAMLQGKNVAFISLELTEEMMFKRFISSCLDKCMNEVDDILNRDRGVLEGYVKDYTSKYNKLGKIFIKQLPTSRVNVNDIETMLLQTAAMQNLEWDLVIIDYFNLINAKGDNSYTRIKNVVEALRGMAMENQWAVVSPTQANRDGIKSESAELSHISESINVAATTDVLFALETSDKLREEGRQRVRCMLTRVSDKQDRYKEYNVNWSTMIIREAKDLKEDETTQIIALAEDDLDKLFRTKPLIP